MAPTFLGLAAVTATNNLLFLLLGATLGAIVLSGILSERNLRAVEVSIRPVGPVYAARAARLEVQFRRPPAPLAAYDLRLRETGGSLFGFARKRMPRGARLDAHLPLLEGSSGAVLAERVFSSRGRARLLLCELSTRFPFGLLVKSRDVEPAVEVWVRPREVPPPPVLETPPVLMGTGEAAERRGLGEDIYGLREWTERDPRQRVHALRSLAVGRPVVLEMSGLDRPSAELGIASDAGADSVAVERTLEVAQAVLRAWSAGGWAVGLTTYERRFPPGQVELEVLLDHLATMALSPHPAVRSSCPVWLAPKGARPPPGSGQVLWVGPKGLVGR